MTHPKWHLAKSQASLVGEPLTATCDAEQPGAGLCKLALAGQQLPATLWQVQLPVADSTIPAGSHRPSELFIRGDDLVAKYADFGKLPLRATLYWRSEDPADLAGDDVTAALSLLMLLETDLLESFPRVTVTSGLPAAEMVVVTIDGDTVAEQPVTAPTVVGGGERGVVCALARLAGGEYSFAELARASDIHELRIAETTTGEWSTSWTLFGEFLEKGVIRRAQLAGVFLPREKDLERAATLCRAFAEREVSLTA